MIADATYPWSTVYNTEREAWSRAVERVKPCAATVRAWGLDEDLETWMDMTGNDPAIEREERQRGGMRHSERREPEYVRLRQAFEAARREIEREREAEREHRKRRVEELRIRQAAQKMKDEAKTPVAAARTAQREPTPPCEVELENSAFFGR